MSNLRSSALGNDIIAYAGFALGIALVAFPGHTNATDVVARAAVGYQQTAASAPAFPTEYAGLRYFKDTVKELSLVAIADAPVGMGGVWKIRKGGTDYAVYLVEITDPLASGVRLRTSDRIVAARLKTAAADYAKWNSADKTAEWMLSNGDLTGTDATNSLQSMRATPGVLSGEKKVWATKITARNSATDHYVGVTNASQSIASIGSPFYLTRMDGTIYSGGGTASGTIAAFAVNDIEMWAYEYDNKKLYRGINGTWSNSGDPAAGTGYMMLFTSADEFKPLVQSNNNTTIDLLAGTDYPYTVPSGFTAL